MTRSVAMYRIGGREYPFTSSDRCFTCQSHHRVEIENALIKGYGYKVIADSLPEQANLTASNIREHVRNGHLPLEQHVRRAIVEDRAKEVGRSLEDATETLVDHIAFARLGIQNVFEDITSGKQKVTVSEAIQLARLLEQSKDAAGGEGIDNALVTRAFMAFLTAIENHVAPEVFDAIADEIAANPVMKALNAKVAGVGPDEIIIEDVHEGDTQ